MSKKKMYNPREIYFGSLTYNTYTDGYYFCRPEPFTKIENEKGEELYQQLNSKMGIICRKFYEGIKDSASVQYLIPLTKLMPEEKHDELISRKLMTWYLLKYVVRFGKYNKPIINIEDFVKDEHKYNK